ncbi:hypothetical protein GBA52_028490 [Prunus armeniaca]|nr:hypothetical protein GBA52_028490 [Prunus armeniaca]
MSLLGFLPAYKVYRNLNSSGQIRSFALTHRVASFAEPFTCREEAAMQQFGFTPVDLACGRLCLSVLYCSSLSDVSSESSTPMSPQLIPDYVGSPLTDPLKRFPSLPVTGSVAHAFPPSSSFSRRHSWSFDHYRASPPSVSFSPSPTYSEPRALISNQSSCFPPTIMPRYPPETSLVYKKDTSFDEYSPAFSPSPSSASPSLPIFIPGSHHSKPLLQSESAPFSEQTAKLANSPAFRNKLNMPLRGFESGSSKTDKTRGFMEAGTAVEKVFFPPSGKMMLDNILRLKYHPAAPVGLFPDDFDDSDFPCPFDVDDEDVTDPGSSKGLVVM